MHIKPGPPPPPKTLSAAAAAWWSTICADWELEPTQLLLLESALQAFDRIGEAREILNQDGLKTVDRFGQARAHPMLIVERDSRAAMARDLSKLNLDCEPVAPIGRPVGS